MLKLKLLAVSGIVSLVFSVSSCLAPAEQDGFGNEITESQSAQISIAAGISTPWSLTRAGDETVPAPIMYYLFDKDGTCIASQLQEDAATRAVFSVERGEYKVYALCGNVGDRPSKANAKQDASFILPTTADVCLGSADVNIADYGTSKEATIGVNHLFSTISLSITDVPSTVSAISATFCELYDRQSLESQFSGTQDVMIHLVKSSEPTTTWYIPETFIYPCSRETMSVKIEITSEDGTKQTVETTTEYSLKSGKKVVLTSQFRKLNSVSAGVVINNGWTSVTGEIDFWNGTGNETETNGSGTNEPDSPDPTPSPQTPDTTTPSGESESAYVLGQRFGNTDAFVLKIETDAEGNQVALLLQSVKVLMAASKTEATAAIASYKSASGNQLDWRIPYLDELDLLMNSYSLNAIKAKSTEYNVADNNYTTNEATVFGCLSSIEIYMGKIWNATTTTAAGISYFFPVATYNL